MITEQDVLTRLETESEEIKNNPSELSARQAICAGCPKKQTVLGVDYCDECKCLLLFKTAFRFSRCPLEKWDCALPPAASPEQEKR